LLFLLFVAKPLLKGLTAIRPAGLPVEYTAPSEFSLPGGDVRGALQAETRREAEVIDMAKKDPDNFAGIVRGWMSS